MHRHPILSALAITAGAVAVYGAFILIFTAAYALGWYAGAPA